MASSFRQRSAGDVVDEIEHLRDAYGVREIHFEDDNFTFSRDHVLQLCEELGRRRVEVSWALPNGVHLDTLDEEVLRHMESAGCYAFGVGIESGSQRMLDRMGRNTTVERIHRQVDLVARTTAIRLTGFFLFGYPSETPENLEQTIRFACSLPLHRAQFGYFLPLPGTPIFDQLATRGAVDPDRLPFESYQVDRIAHVPDQLSHGELRQAMRRAFLRFYARPRVLADLARGVHSPQQLRDILSRATRFVRQNGR